MRIGVDARPLAVRSGIGRYARELLTRMIPRSPHEFYLYSNAETNLPVEGFRCRIARLRHPMSGSIQAQALYPRWARQDRLDVFWSPRHHLPRLSGIAQVVTIHDMVWRMAPQTMRPLGRWLERLLMPAALRKAHRIITVSESTRRDIIDFRPQAEAITHVIPAAPFANPGLHTDHDAKGGSILFVGTFEPRKNLDGLLRAYALLRERVPQAPRLVLAGNQGWKVDVRALVDGQGLRDQVSIVVAPDDEKLQDLYGTADFLVMPSHYEGFGLPLLEAMAFGTPVIAGNVSSMPEVVGPGGLLVDPRDPADIARAMERLLDDRDLRDALSRRALDHVSRFSWDSAASETLRVLELAAARRTPG